MRKGHVTVVVFTLVCAVVFVIVLLPSATHSQEEKTTNAALTEAQIKKLELEVKDLENKQSLANRTAQNAPLLAALAALAGFIFTIYQFTKSQAKDRLVRQNEQTIREEARLHTIINQLLTLDPQEQESVGKVYFLLEDLKDLTERNPAKKQEVTNTLLPIPLLSSFSTTVT